MCAEVEAEAPEGGGGDLAQRQAQIRESLGETQRMAGAAGAKPSADLNAAAQAMRQAENALRRGDYNAAELADWASWILGQTIPVYCYMKHDDAAPVLANQLLEALRASRRDDRN